MLSPPRLKVKEGAQGEDGVGLFELDTLGEK